MKSNNLEPRKGSNEPVKVQIVDLNPFNGKPISGNKLGTQAAPSHQEPVPGLLPVGLTLLMGPSKSGLTTIISHAIAKITSGEPVFGQYSTMADRVAFQTLTQDTIRAKELLKTLANEANANLYNTVAIAGEKEIGFGHTIRVREYIQRQKLKVLSIDPVIGAMGMKIAGSFHKSYEYLNQLSKIAHQTGTAIVAVYHSTKKELDENVFSTKSLAAASDNILLLSNRYENEDVTYYTIQHYGRMFPKRTIYLKSEGSRYHLTEIDELPTWEIDPEMKTNLVLLRYYGLTQADMAQILGISQGQVSKMLQEIPMDQSEDSVFLDDIGYFEPDDSEDSLENEDEPESEDSDTESPEKGEQAKPEE